MTSAIDQRRKQMLAAYLLNRMAGGNLPPDALNRARTAAQGHNDMRQPLPSADSESPDMPAVFERDASHPMLDDFALRAARHVGMRNPGTPATPEVISIEPRTGPWSGYNQLGIEVPFEPNANNEQTVLKLDEWGMPEDWTVSLGIATPSGTTGAGFDVTALIRFGAGGATQDVEIDWLQGSAITLPMNAVNVIAKYNLADLEAPPDVPDDLRLRVTLGRGTSRNCNPTRSFFFPTGLVDPLPIPPFAKAVLIYSPETQSTASFWTDNQIAFLTAPTGGVSIARFRFTQLLSYFTGADGAVAGDLIQCQPVAVPIPPFARYLQIQGFPGEAAVTDLPCVIQFLIGI